MGQAGLSILYHQSCVTHTPSPSVADNFWRECHFWTGLLLLRQCTLNSACMYIACLVLNPTLYKILFIQRSSPVLTVPSCWPTLPRHPVPQSVAPWICGWSCGWLCGCVGEVLKEGAVFVQLLHADLCNQLHQQITCNWVHKMQILFAFRICKLLVKFIGTKS